jgi:hypothetical protein
MAVKCQRWSLCLGARYGLVAGLILELTVVTPDGKIVVANAFWSNYTDTGSPVGVDIIGGSRLLDKTAIDNCNLKSYLARAVGSGGSLTQYMICGPDVRSKPLSLSSACPAWRTTYSHSVTDAGWFPFDTAIERQRLRVNSTAILRP